MMIVTERRQVRRCQRARGRREAGQGLEEGGSGAMGGGDEKMASVMRGS